MYMFTPVSEISLGYGGFDIDPTRDASVKKAQRILGLMRKNESAVIRDAITAYVKEPTNSVLCDLANRAYVLLVEKTKVRIELVLEKDMSLEPPEDGGDPPSGTFGDVG